MAEMVAHRTQGGEGSEGEEGGSQLVGRAYNFEEGTDCRARQAEYRERKDDGIDR